MATSWERADSKGRLRLLSRICGNIAKHAEKVARQGARAAAYIGMPLAPGTERFRGMTAYLAAFVEKNSADLLLALAKTHVECVKDAVLPDSLEDVATCFAEILCYECHLADRALFDVQVRRLVAERGADPSRLEQGRFAAMDGVVAAVVDSYQGFRNCLGLETTEDNVLLFLATYRERQGAYGKMDELFDKESPKGTLFWEGAKRISTAMTGAPAVHVCLAVETVSVTDMAAMRDSIAGFYGVPIDAGRDQA